MTENKKEPRAAWKYALYALLLVMVVGVTLAMRHDDHMEERGQAVGEFAFYVSLATYLVVKLKRFVWRKS